MEKPRATRPGEVGAVIRLANEVFYPQGPYDMGAAFPTLFSEGNLEGMRIITDGGRPVSHVGFTVQDLSLHGAVVRAASLGAVCTLASHQGKGCAGLLMDDAVSAALRDGACLLLVSGDRGLYRRMGCSGAGRFKVWRIEAGRARGAEAAVDARDWTADDLPGIERLHAAEPVRFVRGPDDLRALLECRFLFCRPARTFVLRAGGRMAAYACCQIPDGDGPGTVRIREMAGSRHAVLSAASAILAMTGAAALEIEAPADDVEWRRLAEADALPAAEEGFDGTVKIIDRERFFGALDRYAAERLSAAEHRDLAVSAGPTVSFALGGERLEVAGDAELAALVFGSVERAAPLVPGRRLGAALRRLFPLPLPCPGLSFI
jgi:predicted N-acetyltransferase YhbS